MTEPGGGWASPGGEPPAAGWEPPSYPPSYPQSSAPQTFSAPEQPGWGGPGWAPSWSPMPGVVPLRPLGLGELLDGAVKIIRRYPKPTLALSAALTAVVTLIDIGFILAFASATTIDTETTPGESFTSNVNASPSLVLQFFAGAVLTGALVTVVSRAVLGQPVTLREAWDATRPRFWALLGVSFLTGLLVFSPIVIAVVVGLLTGGIGLLLLLPAIPLCVYVYVSFALAPPALVLERIGVVAALRRSRVLAGRGFWRTFGVLALTYLITSVISSILVVPVVIIAQASLLSEGSATLGTGFLVTTSVLGGVAQVLTAPYNSGMRALLYVDQRMRTEGLDVALQAAAAEPRA